MTYFYLCFITPVHNKMLRFPTVITILLIYLNNLTVFNKMIVIVTNVACTPIIRIKNIARFRSILREIIYWALITTIIMRSWIAASTNRGAGRECTLIMDAFQRHVIRFVGRSRSLSQDPREGLSGTLSYESHTFTERRFIWCLSNCNYGNDFQVHYPINRFINGAAIPTIGDSQ